MAIPKVFVVVRQRIDGKRVWTPAQDDKGKLLQLPGTYYLRYNQHGKPNWKRVDSFVAVPSAQLVLERHLRKVAAAEENDLPIPTLSGSGHSCQVALEGYLAARDSKGESSSGIGERRHDVTLFLRFCGKTSLEEIIRQDLIGWRDQLLRTKATNKKTFLTPRTVYNMMMTVCTWLKKNPLHSVVRLLEQDDWPEYDESDPLPYSEDDISRMLAVATVEESFIVRFGIGTGSRDAEAMHLEKSDIDFKRGTWWIHAKTLTVRGRRGPRTDKWSPKTAAGTRYIPLSDDLLAEIKARPDGLVFRGPRGGYNHKFTVIIADLAARAGLDRDVPHYFHRLRDTFGTRQAQLCATLQDRVNWKKLMGHADLSTIDRYVAPLDLTSQVARDRANAMANYGKLKPVLAESA